MNHHMLCELNPPKILKVKIIILPINDMLLFLIIEKNNV